MDIIEKAIINDNEYYTVPNPPGSVYMALVFKISLINEDDEESAKKLKEYSLETGSPNSPNSPNDDGSFGDDPRFKITNKDLEEWLSNPENVSGEVIIDLTNFYFSNKEDAISYKLRWA